MTKEKKQCERCKKKRGIDMFIADSVLPHICQACWTRPELYSHVQSDLTKAMDGLDAGERSKIIRRIGNAFKEEQRKLRMQRIFDQGGV